MRVSVEDHEPGEILRKLPDIVRQLMQLDAATLDGATCDHHDHAGEQDLHKALKPGEPDPVEEKFRHPVALAMYRQAKGVTDEVGRDLVAEVNAYLASIGGK